MICKSGVSAGPPPAFRGLPRKFLWPCLGHGGSHPSSTTSYIPTPSLAPALVPPPIAHLSSSKSAPARPISRPIHLLPLLPPIPLPPAMASPPPAFSTIPSAITAFANGDFIVVLDAASRENEGDLLILASALTPAKAAFLIHHTSGYLCCPLPEARADALGLPSMVAADVNADPNRTAYTVTVDAARGVTTGISAEDRALTCRVLGDGGSKEGDLRRPGHIIPLRSKKGGVRERQGHTEACVEFARLAGKKEDEQVGVIGELVEDGEEVEGKAERRGTGMMRRDGCLAFGRRYGIPVVTIEQLVKYVEETEG